MHKRNSSRLCHSTSLHLFEINVNNFSRFFFQSILCPRSKGAIILFSKLLWPPSQAGVCLQNDVISPTTKHNHYNSPYTPWPPYPTSFFHWYIFTVCYLSFYYSFLTIGWVLLRNTCSKTCLFFILLIFFNIFCCFWTMYTVILLDMKTRE